MFELGVALRLVEERRFTLEYEPYGMAVRAPDFRVTFRANVRFNVEVRRLRETRTAVGPVDPAQLMRAICDKLGQLPPAMMNVLVLGADGPATSADPLVLAMQRLQSFAAQKDEVFFQQRGFVGTRDFLRHYQRLSAALWLVPSAAEADLWRNPQARHPLPPDLKRALIT